MNDNARTELSDAQWCVLDLLMRARQTGVNKLNRLELLHSQNLPRGAAVQLTYAALIMPTELVTWHGQHDFSITDKGAAIYNFKFGGAKPKASPSAIADAVICLPGPERYVQ